MYSGVPHTEVARSLPPVLPPIKARCRVQEWVRGGDLEGGGACTRREYCTWREGEPGTVEKGELGQLSIIGDTGTRGTAESHEESCRQTWYPLWYLRQPSVVPAATLHGGQHDPPYGHCGQPRWRALMGIPCRYVTRGRGAPCTSQSRQSEYALLCQ